VRTNVNGEWREADAWEGASLLTWLRDALGLTGSKNACEQGECGSCSVWLDDELVCACLVLAAQAHDRQVRTVESIAPVVHPPQREGEGAGGRMSVVQDAFVEAGAVQCGFCTPGFVVAVTHLLAQDPNPNEVQVREALSGNICRCTGYAKILDAVTLAAGRLREDR
jgi:aerobic carbon-monoxide dehydrogenase small subunit